MTVKELIKRLERIQEEHPDAEVCVPVKAEVYDEELHDFFNGFRDIDVGAVVMHGRNAVIINEGLRNVLFGTCEKCGEDTIKFSMRFEGEGRFNIRCPKCYEEKEHDSAFERAFPWWEE